jgi:signal transduction histidine kinase
MNIVMNAAEAMGGRGKLKIRTHLADGGNAVQATVEDTGCGMTEEQLDRLFEPFFTTKEVGHGTGLGMSISRGIVESHGGTIWALSEVGKGTQVHVTIPVAKKEEKA